MICDKELPLGHALVSNPPACLCSSWLIISDGDPGLSHPHWSCRTLACQWWIFFYFDLHQSFLFLAWSHSKSKFSTVLVAWAFISNWIARFGVPARITADCGCRFEASLFHELSWILSVPHIHMTSYNPTSNEMVQQFHRQLNNPSSFIYHWTSTNRLMSLFRTILFEAPSNLLIKDPFGVLSCMLKAFKIDING